MKRKNIFRIPVTDCTFKQLFATEKNKEFLIAFLNSFVAKYLGRIVDITYLPTEKYGICQDEKRVFFDIACKDENGREFIIEMQHARQPEFVERSIFYLSRAISSGMAKGDRRYHILPTYSVNLLDFELPEFGDGKECVRAVFLKDQKNKILTDKVGIFYLNLCNFAAQQEGVSQECRNWLYVLKNMQFFDESDYQKQTGIFKKVLDECRISKMSEMEKENYEKSVLEYEDVQEAIAYAKELAAEEAYGKGIEKGMEKGMENAKVLMAQKMIESGLTIDMIAHITGFSENEILEILK